MKIDLEDPVIKRLFAVGESGEGSLYRNSAPEMDLQTNFLFSIIDAVKPKRILEIGTHKGFFEHFVLSHWPTVAIDTCDVATWSADAIKILEEVFPESELEFMFGDSGEIVPKYTKRADLAWVDGYHDYNKTYADVTNCIKAGIPHILVDDYYGEQTSDAVAAACKEFPQYKVHSVSKDSSRKIAYLTCCEGSGN